MGTAFLHPLSFVGLQSVKDQTMLSLHTVPTSTNASSSLSSSMFYFLHPPAKPAPTALIHQLSPTKAWHDWLDSLKCHHSKIVARWDYAQNPFLRCSAHFAVSEVHLTLCTAATTWGKRILKKRSAGCDLLSFGHDVFALMTEVLK